MPSQETNEPLMRVNRTAYTRKPWGNAIVRRLACSVAWKLSFSVFLRVVLPFPQFVLLHSVTCSTQADNNSWKLLLHCGCQFHWCALTLKCWFKGSLLHDFSACIQACWWASLSIWLQLWPCLRSSYIFFGVYQMITADFQVLSRDLTKFSYTGKIYIGK
jgi:hypothetical protein